MVLPDGVDRETVINNILTECYPFQTVYPDAEFTKFVIEQWSKKELPTWERVYTLTQLEYNPIENYDRIESEAVNEAGKEKRNEVTTGETNTSTTSGSNLNRTSQGNTTDNTTTTNSVAGFNTDTVNVHDKTETVGSGTNTDVDTETATGNSTGKATANNVVNSENNRNNNLIRNLRAHGNIGVTTVAQMMEGELDIYPKINVVDYIVQAFKSRFCVAVYLQ